MLIPAENALIGDVVAFLPALAAAVIRGSVVLLVALILTSLMRRTSASARHLVWVSSILVLLAIPLLGPIAPHWNAPVIPGTAAPFARSANMRARYLLRTAVAGAVAPEAPVIRLSARDVALPEGPSERMISLVAREAPTAIAPAPVPWTAAEWIALVWLIGAVAVIARLGLGTLIVWRTARGAEHVDDADSLVLVNRVARTMRIWRPVTLLRSPDQTVPVTWGIIYPVVLLPSSAGAWEQDRREAVIVHELGHVARLDALTQVVMQFALAIFWFNPLVWIAARHVRTERERACDDLVLSHGTRASFYADDLLRMVRLLTQNTEPAFAALAMARRSEFEGRMLAILDPAIDRRRSGKFGVLAAFVVAAAIALPLAALRPPANGASGQRLRPPTVSAEGPTCGTSRDTHLSISSHDEESTFVFGDGKRCVIVHTTGKVTFTDDDAAVKDIASGGRVTITETSGGLERRYEASRGSNGLEEEFYVDNKRSDPVAGAAWLRTVIVQIVRLDAKLAPARVARIRRARGVDGVLNEVDSISGDYGKRVYLEALLDGGDIAPDTIHVITKLGARELQSDYAKADFLKHVSLISHDAATSSAIAAAAAGVSSDYYKTQLLQAALASGDGGDPIERSVIASVADVKSDYYRATLLLSVLSRAPLSDAVLDAIIGSANHFTGDYYRANVLEALAAHQSLASRSVYTALLRSSDGITASYNRAQILETILGRADLKPELAAATVADAASLTSDYDKSKVLGTAAATSAMSDAAVRAAYAATAKTMASGRDEPRAATEARP